MKTLLLAIIFLLAAASAHAAATLYISPTGTQTYPNCTTSGNPCPLSVIPSGQQGDTFIMASGTYTSGFPNIDCNAGAHSGTAANPITVQAASSRQALWATGGSFGLIIANCSWWVFDGLHIQQGDSNANSWDIVRIDKGTTNITFKRGLVRQSNRKNINTGWELLIVGGYGTTADPDSIVIEENEFYDCWANCVLIKHSTNSRMSRNYINNASNWDNPANLVNNLANYAAGFVIYPGDGMVVTNNICEQIDTCLDQEPSSPSNNNIYTGNIALNADRNVWADRGTPPGCCYNVGTTIINNFILVRGAEKYYGFEASSVQTATITNNTIINGTSPGSPYYGYLTDRSLTNTGVNLTNNRVTGFNQATGGGYNITAASCNLDHNNSSNNGGTNFSLAGGCSTNTNPSTVTPDANVTACYLWVPAGSNMSGAGAGGADIGANILYQYANNGTTLTSTKLWNTSGQPAFAGAVYSGVNGDLQTIGARLHINQGGCNFPAGYGVTVNILVTSATSTPPTPAPVCDSSFNGCTTSASVFNLAGTSNTAGTLSWTCDRCGSGTPTGTATWQINSITLGRGVNNITISSSDGGTKSVAATYIPTFPGNALVLALGFENGSGTTATDSSGNGNNGTLSSPTAPTWVGAGTGKYGNALLFNGTSTSVSIAPNNTLDLSQSFTISAWVFPTATTPPTDLRTILSKSPGGVTPYALFSSQASFCAAGGVSGLVEVNGANQFYTACSGATLPVNTWTFIAVTYDTNAVSQGVGQIKLFRSDLSTSAFTITTSASGIMDATTGNLLIGADSAGANFQGRIDEVRLYNFAIPLTGGSNTTFGAACDRASESNIATASVIGDANCQIVSALTAPTLKVSGTVKFSGTTKFGSK
jgi:hypothetical protein